jgi:hypothetical protein
LTSIVTLLGYPVLIAASAAISYPWISLFFLHLAKKPRNYHNLLQAESEHNLLVKKNELEKLRGSLLSIKEEELIDRAKRDEELSQIDNKNIRKKLEKEIVSLRTERDSFVKDKNINSVDIEHLKKLLEMYEIKAEEAEFQGSPDGLESAHKKIQELREKLSKIENP